MLGASPHPIHAVARVKHEGKRKGLRGFDSEKVGLQSGQQRYKMASGQATVKMVLSGDTVVLMGRAVNGPPPEIQLSLSSLIAPKLARGPQSAEEPFGWASREFLRKLVLGQQVAFKVDYRVESISRDFGTITLNGESVSRAVVKEGWARVKTGGQNREGETSPEYDELVKLEAEAQAAKRGMHSDDRAGAVRDAKWNVEHAEELLQKIKGKATKMLIEYVRDGASFRSVILDNFNYINLSLAGIACPRVNATAKTATGPAAEAKPEPYALEARYFTEVRLLQREVDVVVEGIDKYSTFYGTVLHPKGNISMELLKCGLARVVDYSIAYASRDNALQYRLAERAAKAAQLKIWTGYVPTQTAPSGNREYAATVIEIVSGDTVVVKVDRSGSVIGEERKLSLSSLRAPRQGSAKQSSSGEPWAAEAKEALRNRLVGRAVTVVVDYEREIPIGERKEKRTFASLYLGKGGKKKSVAEGLVADGLAQVIRHRADEERAENYDDLVVAETAAKAGKKGIHSPDSPGLPRVTDLSLDSKKARTHLPFLQRQTDLRAIVEYVFAGSRFKIFIPSESCSVMFALASIRTPSGAKSESGGQRARSGEPFGEEAKAFSRQNLLQRTVEVEIRDMDKNGVALGHISVLSGSGERVFYGTELVRQGFARVDDRGISVLPNAISQSLLEAQELAQRDKAGIWSLEPEVKEEEQEVTAAANSDELVDVTISEIMDGTRFYLHYTSGDGLSTINDKMKAFGEDAASAKLTFEPRKGAVVAAVFDDGSGPTWYRARVEEKTASGFKVLYIDYGNRSTVTLDQLRSLDTSYTGMAPQAHEASLAFLKSPGLEEDYGEQAAVAFSKLAWGKALQARVYAKEGGVLLVNLYDAATPSTSINQTLVEEGLACVSKRTSSLLRRLPPAATTMVNELKEAQETARRGRRNMWRYGDIDSDED